jgi:hypothetical protein
MNAHANRSGFTLVETALALLAISLGLLGIFGLARHGLRSSGEADEETRCTLFAETVIATLQAKNAELHARGTPLDEWWLYWLRFASGEAQVSLFLPKMPEFSPDGTEVRIALGTHTVSEFLPAPATLTEIMWNPTYALSLDLEGLDEANLAQMREAYERGQIDVTLEVHPGSLSSGSESRTYYSVLNYTGGLP